MDLLRSLPLALYLESPFTWLHRLDSRVKLAWLTTFLITPIWANSLWRLLLVGLLIFLTVVAFIPLRVWRKQIGWILALSLASLLITSFMPDGYSIGYQSRLPVDELTFQTTPPATPSIEPWYKVFMVWSDPTNPPPPLISPEIQAIKDSPDYSYVIWNWGPFKMTRRSVQLAVRVSTWLFTLIYGTNLYLLTTPSEAIAATLQSLLNPLKKWDLPVVEVGLTLTLSLRFLPLVLEEVQNLVRSVRTRAIGWRKLGFRRSGQLGLLLVDRLIENLFLRAEQIASAMTVRGFTEPDKHQVQWHTHRTRTIDWVAIGLLFGLWIVRILKGQAV